MLVHTFWYEFTLIISYVRCWLTMNSFDWRQHICCITRTISSWRWKRYSCRTVFMNKLLFAVFRCCNNLIEMIAEHSFSPVIW